jgi:hypothetical protein
MEKVKKGMKENPKNGSLKVIVDYEIGNYSALYWSCILIEGYAKVNDFFIANNLDPSEIFLLSLKVIQSEISYRILKSKH